ncbi:MAG: demethoxyubiquinone hydroxylase family protein [Paracoccaceae bacterium]
MTSSEAISIARIAKVNHAGEYGAIRIYGAQILVSSFLWKSVVSHLEQLQTHEIEHCQLFQDATKKRNTRSCRTMFIWSYGGWMLGFVTALLGPKSIWACTEAVEDTVHKHMPDQLHFLKTRDPDLFDIIKGIQTEEEGHLLLARAEIGKTNSFAELLFKVVSLSVELVVWLSTWGDSSRMRRDLKEALQ